MVGCCVPYCRSRSVKNGVPVSFHEFPLDRGLSERWLKAISRANFSINYKSRSSVVCGFHFKDDDYVPGIKTKRLKPGTVPSIFPDRDLTGKKAQWKKLREISTSFETVHEEDHSYDFLKAYLLDDQTKKAKCTPVSQEKDKFVVATYVQSETQVVERLEDRASEVFNVNNQLEPEVKIKEEPCTYDDFINYSCYDLSDTVRQALNPSETIDMNHGVKVKKEPIECDNDQSCNCSFTNTNITGLISNSYKAIK